MAKMMHPDDPRWERHLRDGETVDLDELMLTQREQRAEWTAAFINDLPDSSFAYIESGGEKDEDGRTTPRGLRHFPHHDSGGEIDLPHLRNALARAPQSPFEDRVMPHLERHAKAEGIGDRAMADIQETRYWPLAEARVIGSDEGPMISGYAAVFNAPSETLSDPFGLSWVETIKRGAFSKTLQEQDIRALVNHDPNYVLGRNKAGTLALTENRKGLQIAITPPDTQWARDLLISMKRGDVSQMSFAFRVPEGKDKWRHDDDKTLHRELQEVLLYDVSVVTFPAYPQTSAIVRSALKSMGIDTETLSSALLRSQAGLPLECADASCLRAAIAALSAQLPIEPESTTLQVSSLRRELDLAERRFALI